MTRTRQTTRRTTARRAGSQGPVLRSLGVGGFTLLELLVAMTILSIMGAALFTMFSQSSRTYERTQARTEQFLAAREALGLMVTELRQAIVDPNASAGPGPGAQFYMFDKGSDPHWRTGVHDRSSQIYFVAPTEARPTGASQDVCVIGYWVYDDPNDNNPPTLMRYCLADDNGIGWDELDPSTNTSSQECGVNVASLTFEYWDPTKDTWDPSNTTWDSTKPAHLYRLPPAVRITLVIWDPAFDPKANFDDAAVRAKARKTFKTFTTVVRLNNAANP